ncbi:maleylpyruvate isomerase family mycothiol-dependent enzyme [Actinophytocola sediminis]
MDHLTHFHREIQAFEEAARQVSGDAPLVPSCAGWSVSDLVVHLATVHRFVIHVVADRLTTPPDPADRAYLDLPADTHDWPLPEHAPNRAPVPASLVDWFAAGAAALAALFGTRAPDDPVWTWSRERTTGFWLRMQTIEAAVHRWDAENAIGPARPIDGALAADAVEQTFTVMAPFRRASRSAPPGAGERFRFRRTDGPGEWTVCFDGEDVRLAEGPGDVELAGTASDLMLFLWQRIPADRLDVVTGDAVDRYFTLVPPV